MSAVKKFWRGWVRWLALLGVSLVIHGVGTMLPTPEPTDPPEIPEPELPEPIAVVSVPIPENPVLPLPPDPLPPEPLPEPLVPQSVEVPPEIEPALVEPGLIEPKPIEPAPTELSSMDFETRTPEVPVPQVPETPVPQVFDATNTDPADTSGYIGFSTTLQSLDASIVPHNLGKPTYNFQYLGELCFPGKSQLTGTLAVALDQSPMLATGQIVTSTGYSEINLAIERWFAQLSSGQSTGTEELTSATGVTLYDWIYQQQGEWFVNDEAYEAYFFNITVSLVNNPCTSDEV